MFLDLTERYGVLRDMADDLGIQDLLSAPAQTSEQLQLQIQMQIRDSLSSISRNTSDTRKDLVDVRERVIRLEENNRRLETLEANHKALDAKVDILMTESNQRAGAQQVVVGFKGWWPLILSTVLAIGTLFTTIYIAGRSAGIISAPPAEGTHPFAPAHTELGAGKP